jgi:hypothetical protein
MKGKEHSEAKTPETHLADLVADKRQNILAYHILRVAEYLEAFEHLPQRRLLEFVAQVLELHEKYTT